MVIDVMKSAAMLAQRAQATHALLTLIQKRHSTRGRSTLMGRSDAAGEADS